ncbi:SGNH/GDSL hydrolase family protein [Nocardia salmonicida]|uniref:SGNH/GDSL hydrolase family protein n=1 Tax=Nocardia salmonicida TaxID=53431 RepID=UPI003671F86C
MPRSTRTPYPFALAATLALAMITPAAGAAHAQPEAEANPAYVALGDSFAAGFAILPLSPTTTGICGRSAINYPSLVAKALNVTRFRDVTCAGATTHSLAGFQPDPMGLQPAQPPQYNALTPDTTLVTLGMGGNDIGLVELGVACINPLPESMGTSCAEINTAGGRDRIGERIEALAPTYGTVFAEIRRRSPLAHIVLVGYPVGIRPDGCAGDQPVQAQDATYLQSKLDQLNTVMAAQAAEHDVTFISLTASTRGHDACAALDQRWMVGALPSTPDAIAPLHPNAAGHANTAQQVLAGLQR